VYAIVSMAAVVAMARAFLIFLVNSIG